jgi:hypothetical protein
VKERRGSPAVQGREVVNAYPALFAKIMVPAAPQIEGVRKKNGWGKSRAGVPTTPQIEGARKRSDATRCRTKKG